MSPEWAADIQSLVAAIGMVARSGMSNTALCSICSATETIINGRGAGEGVRQ